MPQPRLTFMRSRQKQFMPETCTRTRLGTDDLLTMCAVAPDTVEMRFPWMAAGQTARRWRISLPFGSDVLPGDRLVVAGYGTYAVAVTDDPHSVALTAITFCYRVYAADGTTPTLFVPNSTISLSRGEHDPTTKRTGAPQVVLSGIPAFIDDRGMQLKLEGLAPSFDLILVCDGAVDIRDGDYVGGYVGATTLRRVTYIVQHVDVNNDSGMSYKVATFKATEG